MLEVAQAVEAHHLAAGAESRVDGYHIFFAKRRGKKQLAHVLGKHLNGFVVGFCLGLVAEFGFDRGFYEPLVAVGSCLLHQLRRLRIAVHDNSAYLVDCFFGIDAYVELEHALVFAAHHGKDAVRRASLQAFVDVEICCVGFAFLFFAFSHRRFYGGFAGKESANGVAHAFVFRHPLGNDVLSALNSFVGAWHVVVHISQSVLLDVGVVLRHDKLSQRLEAFLASDVGASAALGLVWQINVFELSGIPATVDLIF